MSPRAGGEADKFGNRYEGAWTVRHLLYVLIGTGNSVTVEDIDDLGEGAEFTFRTGEKVEVHQLKRQNGSANSWTVKSLQSKGIWAKAREHVDAGRHFHFVSILPAASLQDLADRVRRSSNLESFISSWMTKELQEPFNELSSIIGSPDAAWKVLCGFWISWPDERDITKVNAALAELLLQGSSGALAAVGLGDLVYQNLGVELDSAAIESKLGEYDLSRAYILNDPTLVDQVRGTTDGWAASVARELLEPTIARAEAEQLRELIDGADRLLLVTGAAGGGKSSVLHEGFQKVETSTMPVLAFRLDRLDPFATTTELGKRIGLDVSPVTALAAVAGGRPSVLIVDQIDAVSLVSGRMPRNFDTVADLVREATAFPGMRVVLACRTFDVENDHRIRELVDSKRCRRVEVPVLSEEQVNAAIEAMGFQVGALNNQQRKILQSPLHLVLLASVAGSPDALSFQTTKHLFDAFWRHKVNASRQRREGVRFGRVISTLANEISARQRLSVPVSVLDTDDLSLDADVLVSEHVLVRDGEQIAFFHESLFDYAFAREWTNRNQTVIDFLTSGEQELFRRGQVRQILTHLRDLEPERFVTEVESLLTSPDVRFHIKHVVIALLGALPGPTATEWAMVSRVLATQPAFEQQLWYALRVGLWFEQVDADGAIDHWLSSGDEDLQSRALELMAGAAKRHPDRLAELLDRHSAEAADYPRWLRWVVRSADVHESRALFDLVLEAVRVGQYDEALHELWLSMHTLGERQPAWVVELLAAYLMDRPDAMTQNDNGKIESLTSREHDVIALTEQAAKGAPLRFCEELLPFLLQVMAATAVPRVDEDEPIAAEHFSHRYPNDRPDKLDEALLAGASSALRELVAQDTATARPFLETLAGDPHEAAQWLLYEGLRTAGEAPAQWSAELLLQGKHRFISGYSTNSVWAARQLIQATSPFFSDDAIKQLEDAILGLRFSWERPPGWYMFCLLSAIDESRLSDTARRRLGELRRAHGMDEPPPPTGAMAGFIGPPIAPSAAQHMNDDHWLRAMATHDGERTDWQSFTGGARELSHVLYEQAKTDQARFARLALRLTDDTHAAYGDAILRGLGDAEPLADPAPVFEAVRHIAGLGQPDHDRWIGWALKRYLKETPPDLVEIVLDRAVNSSDPADALSSEDADSDDIGRGLHHLGINSTRGSAAEALGDLLVFDTYGTRTAIVLPALNQLAQDASPAVRSCVAHTIHACMRHARPQALDAYQHLIDTGDLLLSTHGVVRLTAFIGYQDFAVVEPVIDRTLRSSVTKTRKAGGQLAALAALEWGSREFFDAVLNGNDTASRIGAAEVCAHRLPHTSDSSIAAQGLNAYFSEPEEKVRTAAAEVAAELRGHKLQPFREILTSLMDSAAFRLALPQLLITFEEAPDRVDDLVLQCARRFIEEYGAEVGDIRTSAAGDAGQVARLLIRAYAQAANSASRSAVLDVLDEMLTLEAYGVADVVSTSERIV